MRKRAFLAAFSAAALMGTATIARAQATGEPPARGMGMGRAGRMGGGMDRMLLKGITLTDAQKTQLQQLHKAERDKMQAGGQNFRADMRAIRDARQKGDTATVNRLMSERRTQMEAQRTQMVAGLRSILTGDQQKQLDANLAEMKQHRGGRRGSGSRSNS